MRNSSISSSFATVVARVIDCVAVAGIAVRSFSLHARTREHRASEALGNWQLGQSRMVTMNYQGGNPSPGNKPGLLRLFGIQQPVVCPVPTGLGYDKPGGRG